MRNVKNNTPADFTPEMGDYRTLRPFRYWCQKVLPLVYDDSLSYYELLGKVIDYLNKTMEDVEILHGDVSNLHEAYEKLQNYVNNYFSTLDIQEEINNKLDEMVENGYFEEIIQNYIGLMKIFNTFDEMLNSTTEPNTVCRTNYYDSPENFGGGLFLSVEKGGGDYEGINCDYIVYGDYVDISTVGGTNGSDISDVLNTVLNYKKPINIYIPRGEYTISTPVTIPPTYVGKICGNGEKLLTTTKINLTTYPGIINKCGSAVISGIFFNSENYPVLSADQNPEDKPFILSDRGNIPDTDLVVNNCYFSGSTCFIRHKGRNLTVEDCAFFLMNSKGYAIYLEFPDDIPGESDLNVNAFNNQYSGNRGFRFCRNRMHYCRAYLVNTTNEKCKNIKGMTLIDNVLEGSALITGYFNNSSAFNNVTFQINSDRSCFDLIECINSVIDGYNASGSDAYTNSVGTTTEASYLYFIYCKGEILNTIIRNVFCTNVRYQCIVASSISHCDIQVVYRRTPINSMSIPFAGFKGNNNIDVVFIDDSGKPISGYPVILSGDFSNSRVNCICDRTKFNVYDNYNMKEGTTTPIQYSVNRYTGDGTENRILVIPTSATFCIIINLNTNEKYMGMLGTSIDFMINTGKTITLPSNLNTNGNTYAVITF